MSLRRADHSSRGVLPTVVLLFVWSRNLQKEAAKTRKGCKCRIEEEEEEQQQQQDDEEEGDKDDDDDDKPIPRAVSNTYILRAFRNIIIIIIIYFSVRCFIYLFFPKSVTLITLWSQVLPN
jgi:hypothetical protein